MAAINAAGGNVSCAIITAGAASTEFTLTINKPESDTTAFSPTINARSWLGRLTDWGATVTARLSPAQIGSTGIMSNTGALYNTNTRKWSLQLSQTPQQVTAFAGTAPTHHSYINGIQDISVTYEAMVDDTTALVAPGAVVSAVVFRYFDAATDHSLTGDVLITGVSAPVKVGDLVVATYTGKISGALTAAGSGTLGAPLFSSGTLALPSATAATFTAASGRTYAGNVLLESFSIDCPVDDVVTLQYGLKGTGDLTIA